MPKILRHERITSLEASGLQIRQKSEGEGDDKKQCRSVTGHPILFGVRSQNLWSWSTREELYEIMEPGCITNELINQSDIILNAFHQNSTIFGRSKNGKGTLSIKLTDRGVEMSCDMPETQAANDMLESIRRGDITGMSFAYRSDEQDSENGVSYEKLKERSAEGKDIWIRHVKKVTGLFDVSIVATPAYNQTDVSNREWGEELEKQLRDIENAKTDAAAAVILNQKLRNRKLQLQQMQRQIVLMDLDNNR